MLFCTSDDIKMPKIKNCGATCRLCKKENVFYSILNGDFVYYCVNCKKWLNKFSEV